MSQTYRECFPEKSDTQAVAILQELAKYLAKEIATVQPSMRLPTLKLSPKKRNVLAEILVDFLLDIHAGSGLWHAIEVSNRRLFGTPLPMILPEDTTLPDGVCQERLHFFLWNIYAQIKPGIVLSPKHADLTVAVEELMPRLKRILPKLPKQSPITTFLDTPNDYGWEVKRKLIWLGTKSYLFRHLFVQYIASECDGKLAIPHIDDFVCQEKTLWSGLGVLDILAECLRIDSEQKDELRSWASRHLSIYRITKAHKETLEAINLINDAPYTIRQGMMPSASAGPFRTGGIVFGSLVPWKNEWYWSGEQRDLTSYSQDSLNEALRTIKLQTDVVCRYWKEREVMVHKAFKDHHAMMIEHYGGDFRVFPNGQAWERDAIRQLADGAKKAGLQGYMPGMEIPEQLLGCENGIALFIDPTEGIEMMTEFNSIRQGLQKNGNNILPKEEAMIRHWIQSPSIGPRFIHRVLKVYGGLESIKFAFRCETDAPYFLEYLLRCNKGHYYRPRFPSLSIKDNDD